MRARMLMFIVAVLVMGVGLSTHAQSQSNAPSSDSSTMEFDLPLDNGRLRVRDVLLKLCDELGMEPSESIKKVDWSIDVKSTLGRWQLNVLDKLADGAFATAVNGDRVTVTVNRDVLKEKLAATGRSVAMWFNDLTGGVQETQQQNLGIVFVSQDGSRVPLAQMKDAPSRAVVLVHGMDDPGLVWRDLIPKLLGANVAVAEFSYPNDGPISESADLLASELAQMRHAGVTHVDIVAHSMGGLVARDVLTRPVYYHGDGGGGERFPSVDRFIMSGTPNHGAPMARLRGIGELTDHLYRLFNEGGIALNGSIDGDGEAGADLLPDSDFLRRLNDRALPANTRITIIAGQWSSMDGENVRALADHVRIFAESSGAPQWLRDLVSKGNADAAAGLVSAAVNGLGDGCVTVESTRLDGVDDFVLVRGNHASMILNVIPSDDVPPAIPVILDRLADSPDAKAP